MKNWLKQQATEFTAWTGFCLVLGAFFFPRWAFVTLGIILIAIDDEKAKEWAKKRAPWISKKLDEM